MISVDLEEYITNAQGRPLVVGDDDLDPLHAGHYRWMTTDIAALIACDGRLTGVPPAPVLSLVSV